MIYLIVAAVLIVLIAPACLLLMAGADPEGRGGRAMLVGFVLLVLILAGLIVDAYRAFHHYFH